MNTQIDLVNIAEEHELELIETTSESNGYPRNLQYALIGFDNFEQAQQIADEYGLSIEIFHSRDGWQLWYRTGNWTFEAFEIDETDFGNNYLAFYASDLENYYEDEIKPLLGDFDNLETLRAFLDDSEEVMNEIERIDNDEVVITHEGRYYLTTKKKGMIFSNDTKIKAIGVIER